MTGNCLLLLAYCALLTASPCHGMEEEKLIGWKGDTYDPELVWDPLNLTRPDEIPLPASRSWVEIISWRPRTFIYHNFITDVEARHLIKTAAPGMKRSTVVGEGGKSVEDGYRTSYGTFLKRYQDSVVQRVENRVAAWTHIPVTHQEDVQVLRYGIGQFYKVHADTLRDEEAGVRVATVLIYLNDPDEGGETAFPNSQWIDPSLPDRYGPFSDCAKGHVAFKPKRGDALLFWSINPDGTTEDYHASHTGCPVISGVKWTATKWIHAKPFRPYEIEQTLKQGLPPRAALDPGVCQDVNPNCHEWAKNGDCEKNQEWMVVSAGGPGMCRKSCGACQECAPNDHDCYNNNRKKIGFLVFNPAELKP